MAAPKRRSPSSTGPPTHPNAVWSPTLTAATRTSGWRTREFPTGGHAFPHPWSLFAAGSCRATPRTALVGAATLRPTPG
ncbi:hypothetical protein DVS28_a1942 [Euzebya pacifica]|uniref:Uncharacterized protein n=1 Tax=Euzebya pacifica TaxID=1608957 RepID=A0A346XWN0_9ACTN|nr:hypothetical protein DVS28_a1942 [Euzebya pacifica]